MPDFQEKDEFIEMDFERKMEWFKEEFNVTFGIPNQHTVYSAADRQLYISLINKMCETINEYEKKHEPLLYKLVETMNEITMKYDDYLDI